MDFDIGTFVYILLTLVFILIGTLGKKKKPQAKAPGQPMEGQPASEEATDALSENLKKLFGDFDSPGPAEPEAEPVTDPFIIEETPLDTPYNRLDTLQDYLSEPTPAKDVAEFYKIEDHFRDIMDNSNTEMISVTGKGSNFVQKALIDFDPRKALLYSEIFKPKYF